MPEPSASPVGSNAAPPAEAPTLPPQSTPVTEAATLPPTGPTSDPDGPGAAEAVTLAPPAQDVAPGKSDASAAPEVDLAAGILGPYRELQPLRPWKYGMIYLAVHPQLQRRVLLRVFSPEHTGTPRHAEFLRTARAVAGVRHPQVEGNVLEAATCGGLAFVAQELTTLEPVEEFRPRVPARRRDEGLFPNRELAQTLHDAALGLQAIHEAGLVHGHLSAADARRRKDGSLCLAGLGEEPPAGRPEEERRPSAHQDVTDLAMAFIELVTGRRPPERAARERTLARWLCRQNRGLSRPNARLLARTVTRPERGRPHPARELGHAAEALTRHEVTRAGWGDRLFSPVFDLVLVIFPLSPALLVSFMPGAHHIGVLMAFGIVLGYYTFWTLVFGWTPGRRFRGLYLAGQAGERPPRLLLAGRWLLQFTLALGFGWSLQLLLARTLYTNPTAFPVMSGNIVDFMREVFRDRAAGTVSPVPADALRAVWVMFGALFLGTIALYESWYLTSNRLPLHDYLTGITWCVRRRREETFVEPAPTFALAGRPVVADAGAPGGGRVDQYELRGLLGRGGMGTVYAGYDTTLERPVALKVLNASMGGEQSQMQRFEREARLAARLSHPNAARVFGVGRADGRPYMVMEFIAGETLQQLVDRTGPLPLGRAWDYVRQAALALREAAALAIIHRDIKPSNLMLAESNVVKVTDFGLSRSLDDDTAEVPSPGAPERAGGSLTKTGALMGTPMYMSPEQARAEKLDVRGDIYSLGLTLYYLLAGRPPFDGDDVYDLVAKQCTAEPAPLEDRVKDWTPRRQAVLERMIAKDRGGRFQDYDELLAELEANAPRPPVLAGLGRRLLAESINQVIFVLPPTALVVAFQAVRATPEVEQPPWLRWLMFAFAAASFLTYVLGVGRYGATPGKWLLRLRVVCPGRPRVGLRRAFVRWITLMPGHAWGLVYSLCLALGRPDSAGMVGATAVLGLLTNVLYVTSAILIASDKWHRGLHDRCAGTLVVRLPKKPAGRD